MYNLFNFAAANSSMEQLLLSFILTCTNHLTSALFLFSSGRTNDISLFCRCLFLNDYLIKIMYKILAKQKVELAE